MARRYSRDNRGRFASGGGGATARGGRLKTAAGNKRKTQTMQAGGAKAAGTVGKPKGLKPGAIKAKPQVSSARQAATDRLKIKTQTRRKLRADRASVIPVTSAGPKTIKTARPRSTVAKQRTKGNTQAQVASRVQRKAAANKANFAAITRTERTGAAQGRQYERALKRGMTLERAQNFLQTGKLPGRDNSIAAQRNLRQAKDRLAAKNATRAATRTTKPAAAPKAASARRRAVGADKVARLSARVNAVTANAASKSGVKRMNATEVGVRAKSFLARKAGGMSGMVGKNFAEQQAVVRSGLASRPRYSTQKPNRNKPSRYNALGQDKARITARLASQTAREKIAAAAAKPAKTRTPSRSRLLGRRELVGTRLGAGNAPAITKAPRVGSAIKRPAPAKAPSMVVRTRKQSKSTQRFRREGILTRTRQPGAIGMGGLQKNPRIRRQQTGMSQLSLMGKAKPLVRFRSARS